MSQIKLCESIKNNNNISITVNMSQEQHTMLGEKSTLNFLPIHNARGLL